ncbi:MAG: GrpB family protein [Nitrosomonas ureae]
MKVEIVPYSSNWPVQFEAERSAIRNALGDYIAVAVHHIRSTAVAGLAAKPVINIILEVRSLEALDQSTMNLEYLGYEAMGEFGIQGRRYFRKGGENRTHQIHAFEMGEQNIFRHLAFRDYLNHFPDSRAEYGALKSRLALDFTHDIEAYCDGKDAFIKLHELKAIAWIKEHGISCL